jgi:esterase FrsA
VIVLCGGVDTWKMDLHRLAVATARATGLLVAAVDMPGTGESTVPLASDADRILVGLVSQLRRAHGQPVGFYGISFGAHWAAKLALAGHVDAAVDLGGPTGLTDEPVDLLNLPYGMPGIVGNALHVDEMPDQSAIADLLAGFSLREQGLLDKAGAESSPLLVINGADDVYVPRGDIVGLAGRPETTVWVIKDAGHCALERSSQVNLALWGWLAARLAPGRPLPRLVEIAARQPLRPFLGEGSAGQYA